MDDNFLGGRLLPPWANGEERGGGGRGRSKKGHRASSLYPWRSFHPLNHPHCPLFPKVILILKTSLIANNAVSLPHLQATQPRRSAHHSSLDSSKERCFCLECLHLQGDAPGQEWLGYHACLLPFTGQFDPILV